MPTLLGAKDGEFLAMLDLTGPDVAVLLIVIAATCAFVVWHFWGPRING